MANFIRNTQVKAMTSIWTAKQKARELADRTAAALTDRTGQGTLDVAITVLISIVLGALILAGLYLIVDDTVLPTITQRIKDVQLRRLIGTSSGGAIGPAIIFDRRFFNGVQSGNQKDFYRSRQAAGGVQRGPG